MAKVFFTQNLQRHLDAAPREVAGGDVRAVLEARNADELEETYHCPIQIIAHGTVPHRVLREH